VTTLTTRGKDERLRATGPRSSEEAFCAVWDNPTMPNTTSYSFADLAHGFHLSIDRL
jgi:hypothetical protein